MSEADRVFSRMTTPGSLPAPEDKQFLQVTSRRRGAVAGHARVVEVIHRRSSRMAPAAEPAETAARQEGPQGGSAPPLPLPPPLPAAAAPAAAPAPAPPVGHLMPGWEPRLPPLQPAEAVAKVRPGVRARPQAARPEGAKAAAPSARRGFADPFAADDTGTNCIRCGYLVSPARERRGLTTCLQCR